MTETSWMVSDYPEPPEPPARSCPRCLNELTDTLYFVNGTVICEDCMKEEIDEMSVLSLADALGYEHTTLEEYEERRRW